MGLEESGEGVLFEGTAITRIKYFLDAYFCANLSVLMNENKWKMETKELKMVRRS